MRDSRLVRLALLVVMVVAAAPGCGSEIAEPEVSGPTGSLAIPLTTIGPDGTTYVLTGATFFVRGPVAQDLSGDVDGSLLVDLPPGNYEVTLDAGWQLNRRDASGMLVPVQAVLATKNPQPVRVTATLNSMASFFFLLGSDDGNLYIALGVEPTSALISGEVKVTSDTAFDATGAPIDNGFTGLTGGRFSYLLRFPTYGSATGVASDGTHFRTYSTGPTHVAFPNDISVLASVLAARLGGNYTFVSLQARPTTPPTIEAMVNVQDFNLDTKTWTIFSIPSFPVYAHLDAEGFPVLDGGVQVDNAPSIYVESYELHSDNVWYRTGNVTGIGDAFLQLP